MAANPRHRHHYHSPARRVLYSFILIASVMIVGTVGIHMLEGYPYLDAFYFISMIATAQGTSIIPATPAGKIFIALMSFVSVGAVVTALGFLFGPVFGKLWKVGVEKFEEEVEVIKRDHSKKD